MVNLSDPQDKPVVSCASEVNTMKSEFFTAVRALVATRAGSPCLVALALLAVAGCQTAETMKQIPPVPPEGLVARYFVDRGFDFMDMLGIRVGGNRTFYVRARATKVGMVGAGYFEGRWLGSHGRSAGAWRELRKEGGVSLAYVSDYERRPLKGTRFLFEDTFRKQNEQSNTWELDDDDYHFLDLGVGIGIMAVALDLDFSPREAIDFVLGILCIDLYEDDLGNRYTRPEKGSIEPRRTGEAGTVVD